MVDNSRIRAWLGRLPHTDGRVQLMYEQIGLTSVINQWSREELAHGDGAALILDAAQEHCDDVGNACRYNLQWVEGDRVTQTKVIRLAPDEDAVAERKSGALDDPTLGGVISQILRHKEAETRMHIGAMQGILGNMERMLRIQAEQIQEQGTHIKTLSQRLRVAEVKSNGDEADNAESVARAEAWTKVSDAVATYLVPLLATRLDNGRGAPS